MQLPAVHLPSAAIDCLVLCYMEENMENNNQKQFRSLLEGKVSNEAIALLLPIVPDGPGGEQAIPFLVDTVRSLPGGMKPEEIRDAVVRKLNAMKKEYESRDGDRPGNSNALVRKYFDSMLIEFRLMGAQLPSTETTFFGEKFASPITTAALSHLSQYQEGVTGAMEQYAAAAKECGCLHFVGMCENDHYASIAAMGARTVRIVKPYEDEEKIFDQLRFAEANGAIAVGMDIDHSFTSLGEIDVVRGERMAAKSLDQFRAYVKATSLPFVIKGVLSVRDALLCREIGAKAIVVSHHGGRMAFSAPPAMVLPDIKKAVGDDLTIFLDCGVESGMDAYKALALGADGISVGKHLMPLLREGGEAAVTTRIKEMNAELKGVMAYTGVTTCRDFDPTVIHLK